MTQNKRQKQAKILRTFRKIHRITGALLFVFFFFISVSGILLGWKKHSGNLILEKTHQGTTSNFKQWLPLDSLYAIAAQTIKDSISINTSSTIDRIDVRKDKGVVKFTFEDHFWGLQLDGATGRVLVIEQRRSDVIEKIHDGSILDYFFGTNGQIKLVYSSIMGVALLIFTITGFWLWYGPKQMKKDKQN
ncbi:MAG: PepSY domain-containing protein [Flavobacteriaceae bacterium]